MCKLRTNEKQHKWKPKNFFFWVRVVYKRTLTHLNSFDQHKWKLCVMQMDEKICLFWIEIEPMEVCLCLKMISTITVECRHSTHTNKNRFKLNFILLNHERASETVCCVQTKEKWLENEPSATTQQKTFVCRHVEVNILIEIFQAKSDLFCGFLSVGEVATIESHWIFWILKDSGLF